MKPTKLAALSSILCAAVVAQASVNGGSQNDPHVVVLKSSNSETQTQSSSTSGATFMETNAKKPGVVTLPSGLQYEILEAGQGAKPTKNSTVTVHYEGKLLNGTIFDSSYQRNQPATFPVSGVIAGWQEALPLMTEGSTWMLYIPPQLAYGQTGAGGLIGPNETLIFKVHLIHIQ